MHEEWSRVCRSALAVSLSFVVGALAGQAVAQEVSTYDYDAKGRVTNVSRSGGPSNTVATGYQYDRADNRSNATTTGSSNGNSEGARDGATFGKASVVVLPDFTVINVPQMR